MDTHVRRCITRVRVLALRALVDAGGRPRPGQVARALELASTRGAPTSIASSAAADAVVKEAVCAKTQPEGGVRVDEPVPWMENV